MRRKGDSNRFSPFLIMLKLLMFSMYSVLNGFITAHNNFDQISHVSCVCVCMSVWKWIQRSALFCCDGFRLVDGIDSRFKYMSGVKCWCRHFFYVFYIMMLYSSATNTGGWIALGITGLRVVYCMSRSRCLRRTAATHVPVRRVDWCFVCMCGRRHDCSVAPFLYI